MRVESIFCGMKLRKTSASYHQNCRESPSIKNTTNDVPSEEKQGRVFDLPLNSLRNYTWIIHSYACQHLDITMQSPQGKNLPTTVYNYIDYAWLLSVHANIRIVHLLFASDYMSAYILMLKYSKLSVPGPFSAKWGRFNTCQEQLYLYKYTRRIYIHI